MGEPNTNTKSVFNMCSRKELPIYNMVSTYASYGQAIEALAIFKQFVIESIKLDHIAFTSVLSKGLDSRAFQLWSI